jgi:hypothetical protein
MVGFPSLSDVEPFINELEPSGFARLQPLRVQKLSLPASTEKINLLLTDKEAAPLLGVAPATLRSWRCRGIGPTYVKFAGLRGRCAM